MELEFISNTGAFIEHNGCIIGMDIWLTQGAFEGSWYHFPPIRETKYSVEDCNVIYISHIHPDHCDFNALRKASKETLFIVPNYFNDLLKRKLAVFGFLNVLSLGDGEEATILNGIKIKLFGQFVKSLGSKSAQFGSLIDTALLIEWEGRRILNCNDNYLDQDNANKLANEYGSFDLALMPHSASGPYPAAFNNLSVDKKRLEAHRLEKEYVDQFIEVTEILSPKIVAPTAAEYVIVGKNWERNEYIGLASADDAVSKWRKFAKGAKHPTKIVRLDCGTILDIDTGEVSGMSPRKISLQEKMSFAHSMRMITFRYDWEDTCTNPDEIDQLAISARANLWSVQNRLDWFQDYNVYLNVDGEYLFHFNFNDETLKRLPNGQSLREKNYLEAWLSPQLLYSIVTGRVHWNNAEGGLHIDFYREPDIYIPEVYTLMSFFVAK